MDKVFSNADYLREMSENKDVIIVGFDGELENKDRGFLVEHNAQYSELLKTYVENASTTLTTKNKYKKIFFYGCIFILGAMVVALGATLFCAAKWENAMTTVSSLVTITISFAATFIVLPKIIAEYLFSTYDESNMADIIKNMQEYDKAVRENMNRK